jgi:hypothetical protein
MKVALCFYGQPRFINNLNSYKSYKEYIYGQSDVDVFSHYWFDQNDNKFSTSDWSSIHENYVYEDTENLIKSLYNPVKYIADSRNFLKYEDVKDIVKNLNYFSVNNFYNLQSHLYSYEQNFKLLSQHIENTKQKYDFVIISRYDLKITDFPNLNTLSKNKVYVNGFGGNNFTDAILILDPIFINSFNAYSKFREISNITPIFTSEEYKKQCFLLTNSIEDFSFIKLRGGLLRNQTDTVGQF